MTTIHSVSIIPYFEKGYLFCTEMRKRFPPTKDKELKIHLIGGKVEAEETPLFAACREFCEEVVFDFNLDVLYDQILNCNPRQFDLVVSPQKKLSNRFYIFDTRLIRDPTLKSLFDSVVENFNVEKSPLISLFYWDGVSRLTNTTNLVDAFINSSIRITNPLIETATIPENTMQLTNSFARLNIKDTELYFNEDTNYSRLLGNKASFFDSSQDSKIDETKIDASIQVENSTVLGENVICIADSSTKNNGINHCCHVIRHGSRAGEICARQLNKNSSQFCNAHTKPGLKNNKPSV